MCYLACISFARLINQYLGRWDKLQNVEVLGTRHATFDTYYYCLMLVYNAHLMVAAWLHEMK